MEAPKRDLLIVSGFGSKKVDTLADTFQETELFHDIQVMKGCPVWHARTNPHRLITGIGKRLDSFDRPVTLIGHSYGALLALAAACRREISEIEGLFINGPLNPEVEVNPPTGQSYDGYFRLFSAHYGLRRTIAQECVDVLSKATPEQKKGLITISSVEDRIVPPGAQELPGILEMRRFPAEIQGHSLNPEKIAFIKKILGA